MFKYFIASLFVIQFLFIHSEKDEDPITVSHTILFQESYYGTNDTIYNIFLDFTQFRLYNITKERIYRNTPNYPNFQLIWKDKKISLKCSSKNDATLKCADIDLRDHKFITFDFDRLISKLGGIFSYLLILYGFFSLRRGYVYFNLTVIFYGSFGFILFVREFFQLLELNDHLNSEDDDSERILYTVFSFTLIICILYGYVCHLSKYLKYITFGFINGLIISKVFYYFLIKAIDDNFFWTYFLIELFTCLIMMGLFIFLQNKYTIVNIMNIVFISSYGVVYGLNILVGGLPFLPFFILVKQDSIEKDYLYHKLVDKNHIYFYASIYVVLLVYGSYKNYINYKIATNKKLKI